jgi:small subunit ribosomal protein S8e
LTKSLENLRKRKPTGGKKKANRGRRAYEEDGYALEPIVGPIIQKFSRRRGGKMVVGITATDVANVADPAARKAVKTKILRVKSSPANRDYQRRGVITLGAIIETELGEARVTSRPSREGVVNAVLTKSR